MDALSAQPIKNATLVILQSIVPSLQSKVSVFVPLPISKTLI